MQLHSSRNSSRVTAQHCASSGSVGPEQVFPSDRCLRLETSACSESSPSAVLCSVLCLFFRPHILDFTFFERMLGLHVRSHCTLFTLHCSVFIPSKRGKSRDPNSIQIADRPVRPRSVLESGQSRLDNWSLEAKVHLHGWFTHLWFTNISFINEGT